MARRYAALFRIEQASELLVSGPEKKQAILDYQSNIQEMAIGSDALIVFYAAKGGASVEDNPWVRRMGYTISQARYLAAAGQLEIAREGTDPAAAGFSLKTRGSRGNPWPCLPAPSGRTQGSSNGLKDQSDQTPETMLASFAASRHLMDAQLPVRPEFLGATRSPQTNDGPGGLSERTGSGCVKRGSFTCRLRHCRSPISHCQCPSAATDPECSSSDNARLTRSRDHSRRRPPGHRPRFSTQPPDRSRRQGQHRQRQSDSALPRLRSGRSHPDRAQDRRNAPRCFPR